MNRLLPHGVAAFLIFAGCSSRGSFTTDAALDGNADADVVTPGDGARDGSADACGPDARCPICLPSARRCDPDHLDDVQTCAADGLSWETTAHCDPEQAMVCSAGDCLSPCTSSVPDGGASGGAGNSYVGCEFYAATLGNPLLAPLAEFPFAVVVANPQRYQVTVSVSGGALAQPVSQAIAPGTAAVLTLPWDTALVDGQSASVLRRASAYRVSTNGPVIAYQFNPLTYRSSSGRDYSFTNDASLLLPTGALTGHYTALTYPGGYFAVVGVGDAPAHVTVTTRGPVVAGDGVSAAAAGSVLTYELSRGDVLQLGSDVFPPPVDAGDLTGSTIESDAPVAVFSGHPCALELPDGQTRESDFWTCDHLEDQALPNETWGKRYAVSALIDRPDVPARVRILALQDGTTLSFDPPLAAPAGLPTTLAAHQVVEFQTTGDFVVEAGKPVLVAQFMMSAHGTTGSGMLGDPSMVFEVPVEQFRPDSLVLTPTTYSRNFLNIVGPSAVAPLLDDAPVTTPPRAIGNSGLSVWSLEVQPGPHRVRAPDASNVYGVKVYGIAPYTSYAYPGGMDLQLIAPPG